MAAANKQCFVLFCFWTFFLLKNESSLAVIQSLGFTQIWHKCEHISVVHIPTFVSYWVAPKKKSYMMNSHFLQIGKASLANKVSKLHLVCMQVRYVLKNFCVFLENKKLKFCMIFTFFLKQDKTRTRSGLIWVPLRVPAVNKKAVVLLYKQSKFFHKTIDINLLHSFFIVFE